MGIVYICCMDCGCSGAGQELDHSAVQSRMELLSKVQGDQGARMELLAKARRVHGRARVTPPASAAATASRVTPTGPPPARAHSSLETPLGAHQPPAAVAGAWAGGAAGLGRLSQPEPAPPRIAVHTRDGHVHTRSGLGSQSQAGAPQAGVPCGVLGSGWESSPAKLRREWPALSLPFAVSAPPPPPPPGIAPYFKKQVHHSIHILDLHRGLHMVVVKLKMKTPG